jgi:hypothetical protein
MDDVPLNKIYANLHKSLSPSSSTKHKKKPNDDSFEPMYPSVQERIHVMAQIRFNVCARLPVDHPLQPSMIEPISFVPANAEVISKQVGSRSANFNESSSSHPTSITQTSEPSVFENLVSHYSGELSVLNLT